MTKSISKLPQLVKTAVVAAFIESNLHPKLSTMVPTILIDTSNAIIALYCTKHDLLFISDTFSWQDGDKFNLGGITFLWAMINHRYEIVMGIFTILTQCTLLIPDRYFLQMIKGTIEPSERSGIQRLLQDHFALDRFKQLVLKDCFFKKLNEGSSSDDSEDGLPVVFSCKPPPKKPCIVANTV